MPADTIFKTSTCKIWMQFPSQKKISQSTISLLFQRCAGHIFMILTVQVQKMFRRVLEMLCFQGGKKV